MKKPKGIRMSKRSGLVQTGKRLSKLVTRQKGAKMPKAVKTKSLI